MSPAEIEKLHRRKLTAPLKLRAIGRTPGSSDELAVRWNRRPTDVEVQRLREAIITFVEEVET